MNRFAKKYQTQYGVRQKYSEISFPLPTTKHSHKTHGMMKICDEKVLRLCLAAVGYVIGGFHFNFIMGCLILWLWAARHPPNRLEPWRKQSAAWIYIWHVSHTMRQWRIRASNGTKTNPRVLTFNTPSNKCSFCVSSIFHFGSGLCCCI